MKKLLEQKKIKYATFSALMTSLFIAVILVINIIVGSFGLTFDMTSNKSNSLSEETISYIKNLDDEITIYALYQTGNIYKPFEELFLEYERNSKKITVKFIDPYQNPQFVDSYKKDNEDIPVGSLIVENDRKYKVVSSEGIIQQGQSITINNLEPNLTNAIIYVNDTDTPKIYKVVGHNELELGASIETALTLANFEIVDINLMQQDIPEDCAVLMLTTPQNDYITAETDKIIEYLDNGGSAFITTDPIATLGKTNYDTIIENYGVKNSGYIAIETDQASIINNSPINILPQILETDITQILNERSQVLLLPTATGIETLATKKPSATITPLLTTTEKSYGKIDNTSQTISYEQGDVQGPLSLAVLVTDTHTLNTNEVTNIVVVGTTAIIDDTINQYVGGGNANFVVQASKYLAGEEENLYLAPKVTQTNILTLTFQNAIFILIYSMILLPVCIMVAGLVIFFRRRNR